MSTRTPPSSPAGAPITPPISTRGIVIGTVLLGVLFVAFAAWANSAGQRVAAATAALPVLRIVEPANDAVVGERVGIVFQVDADLRRAPEGWSAGRIHLHAYLNDRELMPGGADIEVLAGDRYRWNLPRLPHGEHTVRLFWSDPRHRPLESGASDPIRIEVR